MVQPSVLSCLAEIVRVVLQPFLSEPHLLAIRRMSPRFKNSREPDFVSPGLASGTPIGSVMGPVPAIPAMPPVEIDPPDEPPVLPAEPALVTEPPVLPAEPPLVTEPPVLPAEPPLVTEPPVLPAEPPLVTEPPVLPAEPPLVTEPPVLPVLPAVPPFDDPPLAIMPPDAGVPALPPLALEPPLP